MMELMALKMDFLKQIEVIDKYIILKSNLLMSLKISSNKSTWVPEIRKYLVLLNGFVRNFFIEWEKEFPALLIDPRS